LRIAKCASVKLPVVGSGRRSLSAMGMFWLIRATRCRR
jgi:hypothetical protein